MMRIKPRTARLREQRFKKMMNGSGQKFAVKKTFPDRIAEIDQALMSKKASFRQEIGMRLNA
ncbi:hypothetical protein G8759_33420 [Spirosoma aureum]|uniref:Uncharacterized protein n=1 Tax=Spirosoma aureum TaxID=2692134 RepID=A0A6G9AYC4_9BACT|nr:hypothetical protein [Spirosoma aureum]QIP17193.1 hypothetical protein G8759_33420 [Spirosoma aureum]